MGNTAFSNKSQAFKMWPLWDSRELARLLKAQLAGSASLFWMVPPFPRSFEAGSRAL